MSNSQKDDIYEYMYLHGSITAMEALKKHNCFRCAARIADLRREGINIKTIMINENGKNYARYVLEK